LQWRRGWGSAEPEGKQQQWRKGNDVQFAREFESIGYRSPKASATLIFIIKSTKMASLEKYLFLS
jgi:hypothetical protein